MPCTSRPCSRSYRQGRVVHDVFKTRLEQKKTWRPRKDAGRPKKTKVSIGVRRGESVLAEDAYFPQWISGAPPPALFTPTASLRHHVFLPPRRLLPPLPTHSPQCRTSVARVGSGCGEMILRRSSPLSPLDSCATHASQQCAVRRSGGAITARVCP